jgi:CheY-like chemotaxis protein
MVDNTPENFEQQVRECLFRLYDYAFLRDQPLIHAMTPNTANAQRVQVFRQIVIDAIETFNPGTKVDFHSRQARTYNILLLRYIEGQEPQSVMEQLALSERQFYREHRRATEALSRALWERTAGGAGTGESSGAENQPFPAISVQSEIQRAFSQSETSEIDLDMFLEGVYAATHSLAEQYGVAIETRYTDDESVLEADFVTLRQAVILILARLLMRSPQRVILSGQILPDYLQIEITLEGSIHDIETLQTTLGQQETLQLLLETLEGNLSFGHSGLNPVQLIVCVPLKRHSILVVEDNPDVVDLFKRYLVGQPYQIVAPQARQAVDLAREQQPWLIILDIMLPGKDGWELLQNFKNHPATKHIPVLICSVLDAPDVALSLGADGYLRKPPGRADFLTALSQWQS